ncbi:MAG: signal peptidase II [Propionibacteriaceae bacterium]
MQAARGTSIAPSSTTTDPRSTRGRGRILFAGVALLGFVLDVVTKVLVVGFLRPGQPVPLVGDLLQLRLIRNPGAAFSLGERVTPVFAVLAFLVLIFVLVRLVPRLGHRGWGVALGLLVAGVAGNLVDRIIRPPGFLRGHVVDFLQLPHWPIFNVADTCITSAAVLIVVLAIVKNVSISGVQFPRPEKRVRDHARPTPGTRDTADDGE